MTQSIKLISHKPKLLSLPKEHGALVALAISTILSLTLSTSNWPLNTLAQLCLWLVILSLNNRKISFVIAFVGGLLISSIAIQILPFVFFVSVWTCYQILQSGLWGKSKRIARESLGMAGAAVVPLALASLFSLRVDLIFLVGACLLASTFSAGYIVHSATNQLNTTARIMLLVSMLSWSVILLIEPQLFLLTSIPFTLQMISIKRLKDLSFKRLGMIEATCLSWVTVLLLIYNYIQC